MFEWKIERPIALYGFLGEISFKQANVAKLRRLLFISLGSGSLDCRAGKGPAELPRAGRVPPARKAHCHECRRVLQIKPILRKSVCREKDVSGITVER